MLPILFVSLFFLSQSPVKESLPGASNVTRVDATIACGGASVTSGAWHTLEVEARGQSFVVRCDGADAVTANTDDHSISIFLTRRN